MSNSIVFNLSTGVEQSFSGAPREAVIAAYAQSKGDTDEQGYEKKYGKKVDAIPGKGELKHTAYSLGDFAAVDRSARKDFGGKSKAAPPPAAKPSPAAKPPAPPRPSPPPASRGGRDRGATARGGRGGRGRGAPSRAPGMRGGGVEKGPSPSLLPVEKGPQRRPGASPQSIVRPVPRPAAPREPSRRPEVTFETIMAGAKLRLAKGASRSTLLSYETACALRMTLIPPRRITPTYFTPLEYRRYEREHDTILQDLDELAEIGVLARAGTRPSSIRFIVEDVEAIRKVCKKG